MAKSRYLILLITVFTCTLGFAQTNRYMVFFKDKDNSVYDINNPQEFLSQKAIDRRDEQVTFEDLPVTPQYIQGLKDIGVEVYFQSRWFNGVLAQMDESLISTVEALEFVSRAEYVAPGAKLNLAGRTKILEDSPIPFEATSLQNEMLGIDIMHQNGFQGDGITIAITDGGFLGTNTSEAFKHIYDEGRMVLEYNFVDGTDNVYLYDDHGTNVFSTIGALEDGVFTGTAPQANFMLFVTEDVFPEYRIEEYNWLFAAEKADSAGVDIIQVSLGYSTFDDAAMSYTYQDMDGETTVISRAAAIAASKGILVVSSAGNLGDNPWQFITAPADSDGILSVGAINSSEQLVNFSSRGPTADGRLKPELVAVGGGTTVIDQDGNITSRSGTSFSAPLVAGLAAGVWQANPNLTNLELIELLKSSANNAANPDNFYGYGIPNFQAVQNFQQADLDSKPLAIYPNPSLDGIFTISTGNPIITSQAKVEVINSLGQTVNTRSFDFSWQSVEGLVDLSTYPSGTYNFRVTTPNAVSMFRVVRY